MATVAELVVLLERGARRLAAAVAEAREAGEPVEVLRGRADAFVLVAYELDEQGDPAELLEALETMERIAEWTARLDEARAVEFEAKGQGSAAQYHAKSARYSYGLIEGYRQARGLLALWSPPRKPAAPGP